MPTSENEEFEFRLRAEKEAAAHKAKPAAAPSSAKEESSTGKELALSPFAGMEAGLHTASGLVAKPLSDIAGTAAAGYEALAGGKATGDEGEGPGKFQQYVQDALTYQPRGKAAKELAGGADTAMSLPGKAINLISKPVGGMIRGDAPANSARGVAGNFAEEGINQGAGFLIGKGLKGIKGMTDTSTGAAAKAASDKAGQLSKENAVRQMAKDEGLVVPSSQSSNTLVNNLKETAGGGASISQRLASITNQPKFQQFVRKQIGLAEDQPVTKDNLDKIRSQEGKAYTDIEQWPAPFRRTTQYEQALKKIKNTAKDLYALNETKPTANKIYKMVQDLDQNQIAPKQAMSLIQLLREEGKSNLGAATSSEKKLGRAQLAGATALEDLMEQDLQANGGGQLVKAYRAAREKIAQTYTVQDSLNPATGEVDASKLYDAMKRGEPVGPELRKAAEFAGAFPKSAGVPSELGSHPSNIRRALTKPFITPTATPKQITPSPTVVQAINRLAGSPGAVPGALIATMPKGDQQGQGE